MILLKMPSMVLEEHHIPNRLSSTPIETESRLEVTRDGGWGEWGVTALWVQGVFLMG